MRKTPEVLGEKKKQTTAALAQANANFWRRFQGLSAAIVC